MKIHKILPLLVIALLSGCKSGPGSADRYVMWYDRPASEWTCLLYTSDAADEFRTV
ncbi:MAG: hypothetical protein QUS66_06310 [Bacteroidota bacterium]|nr:hypothetical protein [Bacteroidota bacterium]